VTLADRILARLSAGPLDDDQLAAELGVARQTANQSCRKLASAGRIARSQSVGGKITNRLAPGNAAPLPPPPPPQHSTGILTEDEVKEAVRNYLRSQGYEVRVAWGHERGVDIVATSGSDHLFLEAKGEANLPPQQVNYFLGALGELVQRMDDRTARYGLALPDNRHYRRLVSRLPAHAREQLRFVAYFVGRSTAHDVEVVE
jgi:hypothetical protein